MRSARREHPVARLDCPIGNQELMHQQKAAGGGRNAAWQELAHFRIPQPRDRSKRSQFRPAVPLCNTAPPDHRQAHIGDQGGAILSR
jgi:hypothetical protein